MNSTLMDVHRRYRNTLEKLGWCVVKRDRSRTDLYRSEIDLLEKELTEKQSEIEDSDHRRDVELMLRNTRRLREFVDENFSEEERSRGGAREDEEERQESQRRRQRRSRRQKQRCNKSEKRKRTFGVFL